MQVELVHTVTSDHFRLDGVWLETGGNLDGDRSVDAILLVHGAGGNFYNPLLLDLAKRLCQGGYSVASFDNTGHDSLWAKDPESDYCCWRGCPSCPVRQYGASVEDVDWCRTDLKACLDWMGTRGSQRVAVVGHSLGAVKAIYFQAKLADPRVAAIIALSPPRLSYSYVMETEAREEFLASLGQAEQLMNERRPGALMEVRFPFRQLASAANYMNKLGPKEKYNVMLLAEGIHVPLLVLGGSRELGKAQMRDVPFDLAAAAVNSPRSDWQVIDEANHFYTGHREEAADAILSWLGAVAPAPQPSTP